MANKFGILAGKGLTDKTTDGFALTFFHEVSHSVVGGKKGDGIQNLPFLGPIERKMNHIRVELGLQKRYYYSTVYWTLKSPDGTKDYGRRDLLLFRKASLYELIFKKSTTTNDAYTQ